MICSCKQKKSVSELSREEKLALEMDDSLTPQEKADELRARNAILDRVDRTTTANNSLTDALSDAREILSNQDFKILEAQQAQWLRQGKGTDINALIQKGVSPADAFAKATEMRADWIRRHVSWAMLIDMPGTWGGLYHSADNRLLEIYEMPENTINIILRVPNSSDFTYTGTGKTDGETVQIHPEKNPVTTLTILKRDNEKLELQCTPEFDQSGVAMVKPLIEGQFIRYKAGEFSPFETGDFDVLH